MANTFSITCPSPYNLIGNAADIGGNSVFIGPTSGGASVFATGNQIAVAGVAAGFYTLNTLPPGFSFVSGTYSWNCSVSASGTWHLSSGSGPSVDSPLLGGTYPAGTSIALIATDQVTATFALGVGESGLIGGAMVINGTYVILPLSYVLTPTTIDLPDTIKEPTRQVLLGIEQRGYGYANQYLNGTTPFPSPIPWWSDGDLWVQQVFSPYINPGDGTPSPWVSVAAPDFTNLWWVQDGVAFPRWLQISPGVWLYRPPPGVPDLPPEAPPYPSLSPVPWPGLPPRVEPGPPKEYPWVPATIPPPSPYGWFGSFDEFTGGATLISDSVPHNPRSWDELASFATGGAGVLGGFPGAGVTYRNRLIYAGSGYTVGTDDPPIYLFDGGASRIILRVPPAPDPLSPDDQLGVEFTAQVPEVDQLGVEFESQVSRAAQLGIETFTIAQAILAMLLHDGLVYFTTLNGDSGRVYAYEPLADLLTEIASTAITPGERPYALAWHGGRLWVGTNRGTGLNGSLYRVDPSTAALVKDSVFANILGADGVDEAAQLGIEFTDQVPEADQLGVEFTSQVSETDQHGLLLSTGTNGVCSLSSFQGSLYVGCDAPAGSFAPLYVRNVDGTYTQTLTGSGGTARVNNGFLHHIVFRDALYVTYWNPDTPAVASIRKFDGTTWTTTYTGTGGTLRPYIGQTIAAGRLLVIGGGLHLQASLVSTTDGVTWNDLTANLVGTSTASPVFGEVVY